MIGNDLLAAPILQPNTTSRKLYLPGGNWYNLHTGDVVLPGTSQITNVSLTDKVPVFIREDRGILIQDTESVRQTKDLGNIFQLVAGFKLDERKSTDDIKYWRSAASILSIKDYNDDAKITQCISQGCQYTLNLLLTITQNTRTLEVDSFYGGGLGLNQLVIIDQVTLYYGDTQASSSFVNPIEISGNNKVVVPIND